MTPTPAKSDPHRPPDGAKANEESLSRLASLTYSGAAQSLMPPHPARTDPAPLLPRWIVDTFQALGRHDKKPGRIQRDRGDRGLDAQAPNDTTKMAADHNFFANLIWQIADLLRGPYRPPQAERMMLPMTVLRRFDCVLAATKDKVVAAAMTRPVHRGAT